MTTSLAEVVPLALVAVRATVLVPGVVGVPEMTPVVPLIARPVGSPVAVKPVGLLVAVRWKLKAVPAIPAAVFELVMTGVVPI